MTALAEAFRALGIHPTITPSAPPSVTKPQNTEPRFKQELPDFSAMSDLEVEQRAILAEEEANLILRQLQEDLDDGRQKGREWRARADIAQKHRRTTARLFHAEHVRRTKIVKSAEIELRKAAGVARMETERAASEARRASNQPKKAVSDSAQAAHADAQAAAQMRKAATQKVQGEVKRSRAEMFHEAAKRMLSKDHQAAIWHRAMEMFPDAPEFTNRSSNE